VSKEVNCAEHTPATAASSSDSTTVRPGYTTHSINTISDSLALNFMASADPQQFLLQISSVIKSFGAFPPIYLGTMDGLDV
jgi:hypothetical protein